MEYPTLFTAGTRWLAPARVTTPEGVTVHEAGHQFWYGIVGNNEFEDAWMDEGFNTFSTARAIAQAYDPNYLALRYFGGFVPYVFRDVVAQTARPTATASPAIGATAKSRRAVDAEFQILSVDRRAASPTTRPRLWLNTMERWLAGRRCSASCPRISSGGSSSIPSRRISSMSRARYRGAISRWFFDQVYRSSNVFDYGVQDLRSVAEGGHYRTTVVLRRFGEAIFPVDVLITFKGGEQVTEHWNGRIAGSSTPTIVRRRRCRPRSIRNRVLLLDVNATNNSKTLDPQGDRGGNEVVAEVDGVAAGLSAVVGGAGVSVTGMNFYAAWRDGIRRVNSRAGDPCRRLAADACSSACRSRWRCATCWSSTSAQASRPTRPRAA